jgi:hypothetical protein
MLLGSASHTLLYLLPVVLLVLPLLAGRYPGEVTIARRAQPSRGVVAPRPVPVLRPHATRIHRLPRGGLLVACAMAVRPPPLRVSSP